MISSGRFHNAGNLPRGARVSLCKMGHFQPGGTRSADRFFCLPNPRQVDSHSGNGKPLLTRRSCPVGETMLDALEIDVKRQKKRLVARYRAGKGPMAASGKKPARSIMGGAGEKDDEAAN